VIEKKPLAVCGCRKFQVDALVDHLCTCTTHSGAKKDHDWEVDQLVELFLTTTKVKTQQVVKNRGHHCGDIELVGYLANSTGPVPLVLDLRVTHDRVGSSSDPALNGHLRYPHNLDQSFNDATADKLRKYRADYNFNPPRSVGFMSGITSTSGRLHCEFIRILFLQTHRETDRFFAASGVLSTQSDRGFFQYLRVAFFSMFKSRVGNILDKAAALRINLNLDGSPMPSTPFTLANFSSFNLVFVFRCSSSTTNPVYVRCVDSSFLVFSLSSHRYSYISLVFSSRFIDS
jgi:hypothetical protein